MFVLRVKFLFPPWDLWKKRYERINIIFCYGLFFVHKATEKPVANFYINFPDSAGTRQECRRAITLLFHVSFADIGI